MSEIYTTGSWKPNHSSEQAFLEAWTEFAAWASSMPGARASGLAPAGQRRADNHADVGL